jgi:hypothetical protein
LVLVSGHAQALSLSKCTRVNSQLKQIFDSLETQRSQLIMHLNNLSDERYRRIPQPDKWSIAQIVAHLVTSEELSLGYMKKKAQAIEQLGNSGIRESLIFFILQISQRAPSLKFKAPAMVVSQTPPPMPWEELVTRWNKSRQELKSFLETIPDAHIRKLIYKHPVAGRLNVMQAIGFYREHIIHHWPQLKRLSKS